MCSKTHKDTCTPSPHTHTRTARDSHLISSESSKPIPEHYQVDTFVAGISYCFHFCLSESGLFLCLCLVSLNSLDISGGQRLRNTQKKSLIFKEIGPRFQFLHVPEFQLLTGLLCLPVLAHAVSFVWNAIPTVLWLLKSFLSSKAQCNFSK